MKKYPACKELFGQILYYMFLLSAFGMELDDVEDALDNPPEQLKEYFNNGGKFNLFICHIKAK